VDYSSCSGDCDSDARNGPRCLSLCAVEQFVRILCTQNQATFFSSRCDISKFQCIFNRNCFPIQFAFICSRHRLYLYLFNDIRLTSPPSLSGRAGRAASWTFSFMVSSLQVEDVYCNFDLKKLYFNITLKRGGLCTQQTFVK